MPRRASRDLIVTMRHAPARRGFVRGLAACAGVVAGCLVSGCVLAGGDTSRPLTIDLTTIAPAARPAPELTFRGAVEIVRGDGHAGDRSEDRVGGLSAVAALGPDRVLLLSDQGRRSTGRLRFAADGRLAAVDMVLGPPLQDPRGRPLRGRSADAESVARLGDGRWAIGFERDHRVQIHAAAADGPEGPALAVVRPPFAVDLPSNGGLEALAALPDGRLLAFAEGPDDGRVERRAWIARLDPDRPDGGRWEPFVHLAARGYRVTDAAALPSGDVLVLERFYSWIGGLYGRLVLLPAAAIRPGATVEGRQILALEPPWPTANYEGVAVVPGGDGGLRVVLVSDDNFDARLSTILLVFDWTDPPR